MRIVRDKNSRSRGYAFIVFERERDMKGEDDIRSRRFLHPHRTAVAYKESDRLVIMGKRVLVDVERGRTVRGWKPRRLGGGLGGRPKPEPLPLSGRGGFRGPDRGDRGGFRGRGGGGAYGGRGGSFRGGGGGFRGGRDDFGGGGRGGGYGGGGFRCVLRSPQSQLRLTIFQVVAEVEALDTKVEGGSVSTQAVGLGGHRTVLVGMALRAVVTEAAEGSVHREVAVGMEVGTVPTLNGRAQGWTRIAIQSDQGIEHIFSGVPSGSHHGVSLPECFLFTFSRSWPCSHVLRHLV